MAKIIFTPPACYGSWLNWVIRYLTDPTFSSSLPFGDEHGNNSLSHGWYTKEENDLNPVHLGSYDSALPVLNKESVYQLHPSTNAGIDQFNNSNLLDHQIIWLHTANENFAWSLNNFFFKIYPNFENYFTKDFLENNEPVEGDITSILYEDHCDTVLNNWPKEFNSDNQLNRWAIREYFSLKVRDIFNRALFPNIRIDNVLNVNKRSLIDNFESTVNNILDYFELLIARQNVDLSDLHTKWLATQPYVDKDQLINDIVNSVLDNKQLQWNSLTIVDEAIIQCILREQGYELKCHGLNDFPTNSKQLRELIYAT